MGVVIKTTLIALAVVLALDLLLNLIQELDDVGQGEYTGWTAVHYLLLTLPRRCHDALPAALLIGGLLGLGLLANDSELVVMRASGVSRWRIIGAALVGGAVLCGLGFAIGEFVAPATERRATLLKSATRTDFINIDGRRGFWARDGRYFINIRAVQAGFRLIDIFIYHVGDDANLLAVTHARSARYHEEGYWLLEEVNHTPLDPTADPSPDADELQGVWRSVITPDMLEVLAVHPLDLSLADLNTYIHYLEGNGLDARRFELALFRKLLEPLANLAVLFIAMPWVLGATKRTAMGQRLVVGILIGLSFFLVDRMAGNAALLFDLPPWLAAALPPLGFFGAGFIALRGQR